MANWIYLYMSIVQNFPKVFSYWSFILQEPSLYMTGGHCFCLWYYWHSRQLYERVLVKCWPLNLSIFSHLLMLNVLNIVLFESILWGPLSQRSLFSRILGGFKSCVHKELRLVDFVLCAKQTKTWIFCEGIIFSWS